jgi:hypothetical protein
MHHTNMLIVNIFLVECSIIDTAPVLPDFPLALKPDDYQLPKADLSWKRDNKQQQENL